MTGKPSKYRAVRTTIDGITFASKREAARYSELKLLERARKIGALSLQPKYPLVVNGVKVASYVGDFLYVDLTTGKEILEDVKGVKTPVYILKRKLMLALHGITIREIS